jgi:hypothetical protein
MAATNVPPFVDFKDTVSRLSASHHLETVACRANTPKTLRKSRRIDPISAEYRPELPELTQGSSYCSTSNLGRNLTQKMARKDPSTPTLPDIAASPQHFHNSSDRSTLICIDKNAHNKENL